MNRYPATSPAQFAVKTRPNSPRVVPSVLLLCASFLFVTTTAARAYDVSPKLAWWYEARIGMFIHFGSYSRYGHGEWAFFNESWTKSNYQTQISAYFNPTNFDATAIAAYAKAAGMKYLVITAKHHEGLAMWHSQVPSFTDVPGTTLYNLYDYTPFTRDVLMELKNACEAQGIKFCLYYSIMDWCHPSQTANHSTYFSTMSSMTARSNYIRDMKFQLGELITNYSPAMLWFDGDWCGNPATPTLNNWWVQADALSLSNFLIALKPDLVMNERIKRDLGLGDFQCPEQTVPAAPLSRPWETCATMNYAWGYNSNQESSYRSPSTILHELVQVVSRDGNYLLNIGPRGDGSMTPGSIGVLSAMASWMDVFGESVHGTTASPYSSEPSWGYYTKKPGRLYAHVLAWPGDDQLSVPVLSNAVSRVFLLNDPDTSLPYTVAGGAINISLPPSAPDAMDSVVVIEVLPPPIAVSGSADQSEVTLSWPRWNTGYAVPGYVVYEADDLTPPVPWQRVTNAVQTDVGTLYLTLPLTGQRQFFRLSPP